MNLLVVGSESRVAQDYLKCFSGKYSNIYKVDIVNKNEENYLQIDSLHFYEIIKIKNFFSSLDISIDRILFTSAVNYYSNLNNITSDKWDNTFSVNVKSILFILKYLMEYIGKNASIVVIASQNGIVGHEDRLDYGTSKAALIHLVKQLSIEFSKNKEKDIRINTISPSYIIHDDNESYLNSWEGQKLRKKIPYKKFIEYSDVTYAIEFLLSEKSRAIRGHNLVIDYGYTII